MPHDMPHDRVYLPFGISIWEFWEIQKLMGVGGN